MSAQDVCNWCAADPAAGFASIGDKRFCHEGESPTCYERAVRLLTGPVEPLRVFREFAPTDHQESQHP